MKERIEVYETLRNEIISTQEQRRNVWLYMYTLYVALFVIGIEFNYHLILCTYVVIIPFQNIINECTSAISRLSAYIMVFFEKDNEDMNWEFFQLYPEYRYYYSKDHKTIIGRLKNTGSIQLGLLTTTFYNVFWIMDILKRDMAFSTFELFISILSFFLFFIAKYVNQKFNKMDEGYYMDMIQNYKNDTDRKIKRNNIPWRRV